MKIKYEMKRKKNVGVDFYLCSMTRKKKYMEVKTIENRTREKNILPNNESIRKYKKKKQNNRS